MSRTGIHDRKMRKQASLPATARGASFACPIALVLLAAAVVFAALLPPQALAAQPKHIFKIATIAPQGSTWMTLMEEMDERVRAETGGEVGFKFYPGGQQGSDLDVLRKIRSGQIQGGGIAGVGLGEIESSLRIMELPFLFQTPEEVDLAYRELGPVFADRLRGRGFELLGWADVGFVYLYSQNPLHTVQDLRGQKVWLWEGDPLARTLFDQVGVAPVPLNITDVLTSLQTGIVNTVYVTPYACLSLQWFTRLNYQIDVPLTYAIGAVVLDAKAYDKLSPAHRETVRRIADEIFPRLNEATRRQNDEATEALLGERMERIQPNPQAVAEFKETGRAVWQTLAGNLYEKELLDRLTRVLSDARLAQGGVK